MQRLQTDGILYRHFLFWERERNRGVKVQRLVLTASHDDVVYCLFLFVVLCTSLADGCVNCCHQKVKKLHLWCWQTNSGGTSRSRVTQLWTLKQKVADLPLHPIRFHRWQVCHTFCVCCCFRGSGCTLTHFYHCTKSVREWRESPTVTVGGWGRGVGLVMWRLLSVRWLPNRSGFPESHRAVGCALHSQSNVTDHLKLCVFVRRVLYRQLVKTADLQHLEHTTWNTKSIYAEKCFLFEIQQAVKNQKKKRKVASASCFHSPVDLSVGCFPHSNVSIVSTALLFICRLKVVF